MFPFFNPGSVNSNGNPPSAAMQQTMMNPGNFPVNPMQFQQQTMNPQMTMPPFNYSAFPFQQAPLNFNQIPQNPAQLLNQNMLLGMGFPNQMQGVNPFFQMPMAMQMPNFNGQVLPGNLNMPQNLAFDANALMGFGYNGGRPQLSMNSNVSNQMLNANAQQGMGVANAQQGMGVANAQQGMGVANAQQGMGVQVFSPFPQQNNPQNAPFAAGQSQGNTNPPPQGLKNHLGENQHINSSVRNTNQQGFQGRFINQQANRNPKFQKFQSKAGNNDERKPSFANSVKTPQAEKRSIPLNYTEQEVKRWREARQKNYPTKANIEKLKEKLKDPEINKKETALRCQQLKEILTKQAQLGCEVAEIPTSYLSDSQPVHEMKGNGRDFNENDRRVGFKRNGDNFHNNRRPWKQNARGSYNQSDRFNKNRGPNGHNQNYQSADKQRSMNGENKREATLLRKLLQTDIKRDKRHLLQVFRVMVMNSFFEDWPEKPLKFPQALVRETGNEDEIYGKDDEELVEIKNEGHLDKKAEIPDSHGNMNVREIGNENEYNNGKDEESIENGCCVLDKNIENLDNDANMVVSDEEKEEGGKQEEGEITD